MPEADNHEKMDSGDSGINAELKLQLLQVEADAAKNADPSIPVKKLLWWGVAGVVVFAVLWLLSRIL